MAIPAHTHRLFMITYTRTDKNVHKYEYEYEYSNSTAVVQYFVMSTSTPTLQL